MNFFYVVTLTFLSFQLSGQDFITKWNDLSSEVSFYVVTDGPVDYTWTASPSGNSGSGSFDNSNADELVTILGLNALSGDVLTLNMAPMNLKRFYNCISTPTVILNPSRLNLSEIAQWGAVQWESMESTLCGCLNARLTTIDIPNLSAVNSMSRMFFLAEKFNDPIENWDVSSVTDMSHMFEIADNFNQSLNNWDVSNVINMGWMFDRTKVFNQPLNDWDVSSVVYMNEMFSLAESFNQPIENWDVTSVTDMGDMFWQNKVFNQPLNNWDVSNVTDMNGLFGGADAFNQPLNNWDVSNVTNMKDLFGGADAFNQPLNSWDVSNVTNMQFIFNQPLDDWDVSSVNSMSHMFHDSNAFDQNLGDWEFFTFVSLSSFLDFSQMSCENYSSSIAGWANNPNTPNNRNLDVQGLIYGTNVEADRTFLDVNKNWTFNGDNPSGEICDAILPVEFIYIKIINKNQSQLLTFSTSQEINNSHFEIQHSPDGRNFQSIGEIEGAGNSTLENNYEYLNNTPSTGTNYYRVKQVDYDGRYEYSDVVSALYEVRGEMDIRPNPVSNIIYFSMPMDEFSTVQVFDPMGRVVKELTVMGDVEVDVSELQSGLYWVRVEQSLMKFIKL